jgi:hypothetical protein
LEKIVYYVMRSKNEVLCAAAGRLAAERSERGLKILAKSLRSYFNLASRAIRKAQFTQNLVA